MRTGFVAGLIATGTVLLLGLGQALSNADFIYMCAGAALLDQGRLVVTPYFPPGYPALLWLVVKAGLLVWPAMTALHAGSLLSALGTGLSAGALAYAARLYRVPPAPALLLALLGASLPDVAEIAFNPHVDALYTGLALTLIVATLRAQSGKAGGAAVFTACLCAVLLLTLRWHAVLVVVPCLLVLFVSRGQASAAARPGAADKRRPVPARGISPRRAGAALLIAALLGAGFTYGSLYAITGSLQSAAPLQVATGAVYRAQASSGGFQPPEGIGGKAAAPTGAATVATMFTHYAEWMKTAPPVTSAMLLDALRANWPQFIKRKAVFGGVALCVLLALILRRWPPQAHWLLLFIAGYSAAVSTTYFTPRASALIELCALVLTASALSLVFTQEEHDLSKQQLAKRRLHFKPNESGLSINTAAFGSVLALGLVAGIGYDAWRVQRDLLGYWHAQRVERNTVYAHALELAGGDPEAVYGRFDFIPPAAHMPWCLPGPSYSRLWVDDPRVAKQVGDLLPEVGPDELTGSFLDKALQLKRAGLPPEQIALLTGSGWKLAAGSPVLGADTQTAQHAGVDVIGVVVLWPTPDNPRDVELAGEFDAVPGQWISTQSPSPQARLWTRAPAAETEASPAQR